MNKKIIITLLVSVSFLFTGTLFATNGYFSHGYGAKSKGMAGAGTALSLSTLDSVSNPAAMVFLGKRFDLGLALFAPAREYSVSGNPSMYPGTFPLTPGTVESDSPMFLIPHLGAQVMLGENSALALSLYGNGGMNTDYDTSTFHGTAPTGVNLMQLFADLTFSHKFAENHAVGFSVIVAYQMFEANGLEAFTNFSRNPAAVTGQGMDKALGYGFRLGYLGKFSKYLSLGASYQSKIMMGEFDNYAGLFAEGGNFDIPATFNVGIAVTPVESITIAVDVQHIMFSKVKSISNSFNPAAFMQGILLGDDDGAGFAWEDMTIFKMGLQFTASEKLVLRAGFSTGNQPVSEVMFNMLAPGVIEKHLTMGATLKLSEKNELTFYLMHAFSNSVSGPNPMEAPNQQTIELKMGQWEAGLAFSF